MICFLLACVLTKYILILLCFTAIVVLVNGVAAWSVVVIEESTFIFNDGIFFLFSIKQFLYNQ